MCAGCVSSVDAWVYTAVGVGAAAEAGINRVRALFDPVMAAERHVRVWDRNAEFCAYMGLDAVEVLGSKPAPEPVAEVRWSPSPTMAMFATT